MLRLLQLVHGYPPAVGGVERSTRDLCEALVAEHGFEVTVATTDAYTVTRFHDPSQPTIPIRVDEVQSGVRVLRFPADTRWSSPLRHAQRVAWRLHLPGNDRLRTWFNGPRSPGLLQAARTLDADVVCAASFPLNHMRYPFLRPEPRPPIVLVPAAHTNDTWGFDRPYLLRLTQRAYASVAHTDHERDWLISKGAPPERVRVIGHGIDPDALRPRRGAFRAAYSIDDGGYLIAFVGQHGRHKGIETLVEAFARLAARAADAWLVVGGARTPYTPVLEHLVAGLPPDAHARVRLVTDLGEQEKADLLGDCDVFASPSAAESFGITTLEAWALRKPVIVGDTPSQRSIVDEGVTGLRVRPGNADSLLAALKRLTDQSLRRALGEAGNARVRERFTRRQVEQAYADLFREAVAAQRRPRSAGANYPSG